MEIRLGGGKEERGKVEKRKSASAEEKRGCRFVDLLINWSLFPQVGSLFVSRSAGGGIDGD
ncbi:MAG: hypothetical protein AB9882_14155 [Ignavibacteriaceae bacterium]